MTGSPFAVGRQDAGRMDKTASPLSFNLETYSTSTDTSTYTSNTKPMGGPRSRLKSDKHVESEHLWPFSLHRWDLSELLKQTRLSSLFPSLPQSAPPTLLGVRPSEERPQCQSSQY